MSALPLIAFVFGVLCGMPLSWLYRRIRYRLWRRSPEGVALMRRQRELDRRTIAAGVRQRLVDLREAGVREPGAQL